MAKRFRFVESRLRVVGAEIAVRALSSFRLAQLHNQRAFRLYHKNKFPDDTLFVGHCSYGNRTIRLCESPAGRAYRKRTAPIAQRECHSAIRTRSSALEPGRY